MRRVRFWSQGDQALNSGSPTYYNTCVTLSNLLSVSKPQIFHLLHRDNNLPILKFAIRIKSGNTWKFLAEYPSTGQVFNKCQILLFQRHSTPYFFLKKAFKVADQINYLHLRQKFESFHFIAQPAFLDFYDTTLLIGNPSWGQTRYLALLRILTIMSYPSHHNVLPKGDTLVYLLWPIPNALLISSVPWWSDLSAASFMMQVWFH